MIVAQAKENDLTILEDGLGRVPVEMTQGLIGSVPGDDSAVFGLVAACDPHRLFALNGAVMEQMRVAMPALAEALRWSGEHGAGASADFPVR